MFLDCCPGPIFNYNTKLNCNLGAYASGPVQICIPLPCACGPPDSCGDIGTWPSSAVGLPYTNSAGDLSSIDTILGSVTSSSGQLRVTGPSVSAMFLFGSSGQIAAGDFTLTLTLDHTNVNGGEFGLLLSNNENTNGYLIGDFTGDSSGVHAQQNCTNTIDPDTYNEFCRENVTITDDTDWKFVRRGQSISVYQHNVLLTTICLGVTQISHVGLYCFITNTDFYGFSNISLTTP